MYKLLIDRVEKDRYKLHLMIKLNIPKSSYPLCTYHDKYLPISTLVQMAYPILILDPHP